MVRINDEDLKVLAVHVVRRLGRQSHFQSLSVKNT